MCRWRAWPDLLNYRLNPKEQAQIVDDAEATVLLVEPKYLPQMLAERERCRRSDDVTFGDEHEGADARYEDVLAEGRPSGRARPERARPGVADYTRTTGRPKGALGLSSMAVTFEPHPEQVLFPERKLMSLSTPEEKADIMRACGMDDVWVCPFTLELARMEPEDFMRQVERHRITTTPMAPTMLNMLLQHPSIDQYDLSSITGIAYGGASMPVEVLKRAMGGSRVWSSSRASA